MLGRGWLEEWVSSKLAHVPHAQLPCYQRARGGGGSSLAAAPGLLVASGGAKGTGSEAHRSPQKAMRALLRGWDPPHKPLTRDPGSPGGPWPPSTPRRMIQGDQALA